MIDVQDLKSLFEVIDVKAQSRFMEDPCDASLRRFKDKWLFIITLILILFSFMGGGLFIAYHPDSPQLGIFLNGGFGLVMALAGYYVRGRS